MRTPVETAALIFDGNLGLGTLRTWAQTFDLSNARTQASPRYFIPINACSTACTKRGLSGSSLDGKLVTLPSGVIRYL